MVFRKRIKRAEIPFNEKDRITVMNIIMNAYSFQVICCHILLSQWMHSIEKKEPFIAFPWEKEQKATGNI